MAFDWPINPIMVEQFEPWIDNQNLGYAISKIEWCAIWPEIFLFVTRTDYFDHSGGKER